MSSSSSPEESNVSSHMSESDLLLFSVTFEPSGVHFENEYGLHFVQNLNDLHPFMAAKSYDALPSLETNVLTNSLCKIWDAFLASKLCLNGAKSCVNSAVQHSISSTIDAGDGMLARVSDTCIIKGQIAGPDDTFPHLTKVVSDESCGEIELRPGVTYIIHGDEVSEIRYCGSGRSEMSILSFRESFLRLGITEFRSPPLSHTIWCVKGTTLYGTIRNAVQALCEEHCDAKCENRNCLNGQGRSAKYVYVKSKDPLKVYDFRTRYDPLGGRYGLKDNALIKALKSVNPDKYTQKSLLRTLMVVEKLRMTLPANQCWVLPGNREEAVFNPEKPYLKANGLYLLDLYPHDAEGDAVSLWDGKKVLVTMYGQIAHVSTRSGSILEPGTRDVAWAGV